MDIQDELQQERDIAEGYRQLYVEALARIQLLKLELEAAETKQVYATWGHKRADALDI